MPRLKNNYDFMAGMYVEGELYFNKYSLTIDFYTLTDDSMANQNIAVDRITAFIYDTVQRSIFIDEGEFEQINLLTAANLPVLTVPSPGAFDPIVLATMITKMNSIIEDVLVITDAEIVSAMSGPLTYVWDSADEEDEVHKIVNDSDDVKWWATPQPRYGSYPDGCDVAKIEEKSPFPLTWKNLNLGWADEYTEEDLDTVVKSVKSNGTIIKADFASKPNPKKK